MTGRIASYAAKKALGKEMDKYRDKKPSGANDPFFEYITLPNGKKKKVRKQIPDYIPEHDALVLEKAKKVAYRLDVGLFSFAGIQFGWGSVIGLIPELGDLVDLACAFYVMSICCHVEGGLGLLFKVKMVGWILLDFLVGLVPFVGDLADAALKCNTRNVAKLEEELMNRHGPKNLSPKEKHRSRLVDMNDDAPKRTFTEEESLADEPKLVHEPPRKSQKSGRGHWYGRVREQEPDVETGGRHNARR